MTLKAALSPEAKPAFFHGPRTENKIAFTFDACPSSEHGGYDENVIKVLTDSGVPATFFLTGTWIKKHINTVKKLSEIKYFELENHSFSHPHCVPLPDLKYMKELVKTDSIIKAVTGRKPVFFRPPYGEMSRRMRYIADSLGLATVMYDLASGDPDTTFKKQRLVHYVLSHAKNGSIIVMHVNRRGWHTAEALPEIIGSLRKKGFVFVKVSDLYNNWHAWKDSPPSAVQAPFVIKSASDTQIVSPQHEGQMR